MSESIPVAPGDGAAASAVGLRLAAIRGLLGRARSMAAHHGVWSVGVRLQRNLSLRSKALLAAVLVALPLCGFVASSAVKELASYQQSQRRLSSLDLMHSLSRLALSATQVQRGALLSDLGLPGSDVEAALKADQARFDDFMRSSALADWPASTQAAVQAVKARRDAVLKHATDASTQALPGRGGPRMEAIADYSHELIVLRGEVARASGVTADAPSSVQAVNTLLARSLPKLRWQMARFISIGAPLYSWDDRDARARRLSRFTMQASGLLDSLESDLIHAMDQGLVDASLVREVLPLARAHVDRAEALALAAPGAGSAAAVAQAAGFDREAYRQSGLATLQAFNRLEDALFERFSAWAVEQGSAQQRHLAWFVAVLVGWLLLASYMLVCSYKVLAGGLRTLVGHLEALGRGELVQRQLGHGKDEIGRALTALAKSTGHMSQLFGAVTQGVAAVSHASREVAGGNAGLTSRSSDVQGLIAAVAERAQACSASLDTCGEQVEQTADLVRGMRADGQRSRKAVGGLREGMARLQGKSREIGQVVSLVEAVAHQTKLLSINASVEAARAGEAGRGFAVVAKEVRALALRSERAAQRIAGIVSASIDEIEHCGLMAGRTDETVQRNEQKIEEVDALMRDTVRLTRAGRSDSQEVLTIARGVEESMGGNVRVVRQLAAASASLRTQGDHLKRSLQHFNFG